MSRKEVVIAAPGAGKSSYLALRMEERGALALDPTGGLAKRVTGRINVVNYDAHAQETWDWLRKFLDEQTGQGKPLLINFSGLFGEERQRFAEDLGTHLLSKQFGGLLIIDEAQWILGQRGNYSVTLAEYIAKCRNYGCEVIFTAHRAAMINKDVMALADTFRFGRAAHPLDIEAASKVLLQKTGKSGLDDDDLTAKFAGLEPGHWYVLTAAEPGTG